MGSLGFDVAIGLSLALAFALVRSFILDIIEPPRPCHRFEQDAAETWLQEKTPRVWRSNMRFWSDHRRLAARCVTEAAENNGPMIFGSA
jgi:hypothetical protein